MPAKIKDLTPEKKAKLKKDILAELDSKGKIVSVLPHKILAAATKPAIAPLHLVPQVKAKAPIKSRKIAKPIVPAAILPNKLESAATLKRETIADISQENKSVVVKKAPIKKLTKPAAIVKTTIPSSSSGFSPQKEIITMPRIKSANNKFGWWRRWLIVGAAVIVLALAIDILGLYKFGWQDGFSQLVAKVLSLPAGKVNGQKIKLADYFTDLKIMKVALEKQREGASQDLLLTANEADLPQNIFNRLIVIKLMEAELTRYQKSLTAQELDDKMKLIVNQFANEAEAQKTIEGLYNLSLNQFKEKVLRPLLLQDKLQELISQDESLKINQEARTRAEEVLKLALESGVDFIALANQYTEDEAGVNTGGDWGWISQGEAAKEIEDVIFSLADNTVYNQLIKNRLGYHIVKVENKMIDSDDGHQSVRARHILIRVSVQDYLKSLFEKAKIKNYLFSPNK